MVPTRNVNIFDRFEAAITLGRSYVLKSKTTDLENIPKIDGTYLSIVNNEIDNKNRYRLTVSKKNAQKIYSTKAR